MTAFRDPFKGLPNITPENALNIRLENLRNVPDASGDFIAAVDKLITIRDIFLIAKESGYLEQIPYWGHFQTILRWLNKEADLGPYMSAAQIQDYREIDAEKASSLLGNTTSLENDCNANTDYRMSATVRGSIIAQKRINTEPKLIDLIETQENRIKTQQDEFDKSITAKEDQVNKNISTKTDKSIKAIQTEAEGKLSAIQQADALKEWQKYYDELLGKKITKPKIQKWLESNKEDKRRIRVLKWSVRLLPNTAKKVKNNLKFFILRLFPSTEGYNLMADQHKLWRNVWLFCLVGSATALTYLFTNTWHLDYKKQLAQILAYKLAVALLFGALYVSANKNYRIYANLADQVKHRSVVAKTIRGIILDQSIGDAQKDYKAELVSIGARAMFELKTTGHLTKKESTSPVFDLFRDAAGR